MFIIFVRLIVDHVNNLITPVDEDYVANQKREQVNK